MISHAESGLSLAQYNALKQQFTDYKYKVIAKRYNVDFGTSAWFTSPTVTDGTTPDFDAVVMGGYLFRASGTKMERIDLVTGSVTLLSAWESGLGGTPLALALVAEGTTLYGFTYGGTQISRRVSTDFGVTWNSVNIFTIADQTFYGGNVARGGEGSASSVYTIGEISYPGSNAFNGIGQWQSDVGVTAAQLLYIFESGITRVVRKYSITAPSIAAPKDWTFEGYDGASWDVLDTQSGVTGWGTPETKTYTFSNSTAYDRYRLNITDENGFGQIFVNELAMYELSTDEALVLLSAPTPERVHFVRGDSATNTYNLRVINFTDPTWTDTNSDITLTDRPLSMDVVTNGERDFIILESETPGQITTYLDVTTLKFKRLKAKGLLCFNYHIGNPSWSPHTIIDSLDELTAFTNMKNVKVEYTNDTIYVTAYRTSGSEDNPVTGYRVYTSKDGIHWSSPRLFALGAAQSYGGAKWLVSGDYLYAVERHVVWRSYATDFVGSTPTAISQDITPYVSNMALNKGDMAQVALELDNADGWLDGNAFINENSVVKVEVYLGGTDEDGVDRLYLDTTGYIDTFSVDEAIAGNSVRYMKAVSARDATSWMTDDTTAEDAHIFDGFRVGADSFLAETESDYGGLAHWWPVYGDWKTDDGQLVAPMKQTAYNYAVGRSTLFDFLWNGAIEAAVSMPGCDAFAGVSFRGKSINNLFFHWFWGYDRVSDKLKLQYRIGFPNDPDRAFTVYESSTKSWTSDIQSGFKWLRAEFYYGTMYLYYSGSGVDWTLETTQTVNCYQKQGNGLTGYDDSVQLFDRVEAGYVGLEAQVVADGTVPASADRVLFKNLFVSDFGQPLNIEKAFKTFAAFANIHDWTFDDSYNGGSDGWTLGSGVTLEASGSGASVYGEAIYGVSTYG